MTYLVYLQCVQGSSTHSYKSFCKEASDTSGPYTGFSKGGLPLRTGLYMTENNTFICFNIEPPKAHVGCLDTSCSYQQLAAENDVIKSQAHGWSIAATSSFHNMQDVQALGVDTTRGSRGSGASAKKK